MTIEIYGAAAESSYSERKKLASAYAAMLLPLPLQLNCRLVFNDGQRRERADHLVSMFLDRLQGRVSDELVWAIAISPRQTYISDVWMLAGLRGGGRLPRVHVDKSWRGTGQTYAEIAPVADLRAEVRAFLQRCRDEPRLSTIDGVRASRSA